MASFRDNRDNLIVGVLAAVIAGLILAALLGYARSSDAESDADQLTAQSLSTTASTQAPTTTSTAASGALLSASTTSTPPATTTTTSAAPLPVSTTAAPLPLAESVFVTDLELLRWGSGCEPRLEPASISSGSYNRSVVWRDGCYGEEEAAFLVEKRFARLTAVVGLSTESDVEAQSSLEVWGDNTRLATYDLRYGESQPIEVDVSNVIQLRFLVFDNESGESQIIGDPQLSP